MATCKLEMKDGNVWKTIAQLECPIEDVDKTLAYLGLVGDKQYARHAKRRVRRSK